MPKSPPLATLDMVLRTPEALASLLSHLVLVSDSPEPHLPATRDLPAWDTRTTYLPALNKLMEGMIIARRRDYHVHL
jgi:hypothetical protein